uniref:Uncharacterized protein n=1 Tax=Bosea sp. NBC_00436 TaxID=2969620 RepID=A0A9E7ZPQ8_9HYPH
MGSRTYTFDALTQLKDAGAITASAPAQVGGQAKVLDMGAGRFSIKYVRAPQPGQWPLLFAELVTTKAEAYILRGLNEDTDNARRRDADVEALLEEARSALDRQEPPRAIFRSRTAARRLGRGSRSLTVR